MSDADLIERLEDVLTALERIPRRFAGVDSAAAFGQSEEGQDRLDAICMILVAVGEAMRQLDRKRKVDCWRAIRRWSGRV